MYKYPDQFTNITIRPVALPLVVSKFFGVVKEVDSHNKSRQSYLALEKFWVTQCGYLWLCTIFAMGITITNFRKLLHYRAKRYHYDKLIGIREFAERIALNLFNNPFSTDTGTPVKNIPPLDEVYERKKVSTFHALYFPFIFTPLHRPAIFPT